MPPDKDSRTPQPCYLCRWPPTIREKNGLWYLKCSRGKCTHETEHYSTLLEAQHEWDKYFVEVGPQQYISELEAKVEELVEQKNTTFSTMMKIRKELDLHKAKVEELQAILNNKPKVDPEITQLTNDLKMLWNRAGMAMSMAEEAAKITGTCCYCKAKMAQQHKTTCKLTMLKDILFDSSPNRKKK